MNAVEWTDERSAAVRALVTTALAMVAIVDGESPRTSAMTDQVRAGAADTPPEVRRMHLWHAAASTLSCFATLSLYDPAEVDEAFRVFLAREAPQ